MIVNVFQEFFGNSSKIDKKARCGNINFGRLLGNGKVKATRRRLFFLNFAIGLLQMAIKIPQADAIFVIIIKMIKNGKKNLTNEVFCIIILVNKKLSF